MYCLERRCFSRLYSLRTAFIPNSIIQLNHDIFSFCSKLESVVFEKDMKLKRLVNYMFYYTNLTFIDIPSSVTLVDQYAFAHMNNLRVIYAHSLLKSHSNAFENTNTSNIRIYAPLNYPEDNVLGIPVIKELTPNKSHRKTRCICSASRSLFVYDLCLLVTQSF